jgi:hypothetical protein
VRTAESLPHVVITSVDKADGVLCDGPPIASSVLRYVVGGRFSAAVPAEVLSDVPRCQSLKNEDCINDAERDRQQAVDGCLTR